MTPAYRHPEVAAARVVQEETMPLSGKGYSVLLPEGAFWRESNMMKIPNTNLAAQLGAKSLGARLWRLPPYSANTWHKHVEQEELYVVLEGTGRIRVGRETLTVPRYGAVLVSPPLLRQVFNDTAEEVLWLIVGGTGRGRRPGGVAGRLLSRGSDPASR